MGDATDPGRWYQHAVIYQAHVRAFFDSNDDGIGDFAGLTQKLDYIQSLGVSAIWLLPFYPSPLRDDGYDIADYEGIHKSYGRPEDFRTFLDAAHARGLKVITELVINHTSDQHPWFQTARQAPRDSTDRQFYVWSDSDQKYPGVRIIFSDTERSNWTWDPVAGQYYWHRFFHHQPDLNFDHPPVRDAVIKVMRYWLDQGVDGLRLDAVPYLIERDGTSCANLPETHDVLRELRRELDAHYQNRMLLAEANLWPSDVIAYFGDGDECHMAFHFPLMPRLYMALRQEDRHPISEILWQTPEIPSSCQWAIFLRNHDELTLEMVTHEERDYMYQAYAADPVMRVNAGIRRRLAPLLENSRARIELMHGLLLSLPGTPIIYYGDEIGMGDNVYLGDRNGVRTPMQWTVDRNGGFSHADPARLFAPMIMDAVYGYQAVNVEAQDRSPHSLLNWMRRAIALRLRHRAFGLGSIELLRPENRRVLAFIRHFAGEDPILVVANLARTMQAVALDLSKFAGLVPVELSGGTELPRITEAPYGLTIGAHDFYWLALRTGNPDAIAAGQIEPDAAQLPLLVGPDWSVTLRGGTRSHLERYHLPAYLHRQPWAGPRPESGRVRIDDWVMLRTAPEPAALALVNADGGGAAEADGGGTDRDTLPIVMLAGAEAEEFARASSGDVVARIAGDRDGIMHGAFDASTARALVLLVAGGGTARGRHGELRGVPTPAFSAMLADAATLPVTPLIAAPRGTNALVRFGEQLVVKLYRRTWPGTNPEIEACGFLTEQSLFPRAPRLLGFVDYSPTTGPSDRRTLGPSDRTIAALFSYAPHQLNAWAQALDELGRFYENAVAWEPLTAEALTPLDDLDLWTAAIPERARLTVGAFLENMATLGRRTAELHAALAPIRRIHGTYTIADALLSEGDYWIIDFEGDSNRPFEDRALHESPLADLTSLIASLRAVAQAGLATRLGQRPQDADRMTPWARWWWTWSSASFAQGYRIAAPRDLSPRLRASAWT